MDPGELNRKITIQSFTPDSVDEEIKVWANVATPWAKKVHRTSREFFAAQKINSETTDLFIIRYRTGIDTKMRVVFDGRNYDIIGADDPDGSRTELHILCAEVI